MASAAFLISRLLFLTSQSLVLSMRSLAKRKKLPASFFTKIPALGVARGFQSTWSDSIQFMGLPFGLPPDGDLLLMPPVPYPKPWQKEHGMSGPPPKCRQQSLLNMRKITGQRDCLYLNVFVPRNVGERLVLGNYPSLPVMFFIYGGAFISGDSFHGGLYDASSIAAKQNVVVVTSNYRVGIEGFLAHPAMRKNGGQYNLGLLDQRLAMNWVNQHINAFGGNPDHVVIFGESAGAISICFHLTSPLSFPYFHGAIMESSGCEGSSLWQDRRRAEIFGESMASAINCTGLGHDDDADPGSEMSCLRENIHKYNGISFTQLAAISLQLGAVPDSSLTLAPVVDESELGLTGMPTELIEEGRFHNVPIIVGTNRNEGSIFSFLNPVPGSDKQTFADLVHHVVGPDLAEDLFQLYGGIGSASKFKNALAELLGDLLFICPTYNFIRAMARQNAHVYSYRLLRAVSAQTVVSQTLETIGQFISNKETKFEKAMGLYLAFMGAPHSIDLFFVFDVKNNPAVHILDFHEKEVRLSEHFQSYWGQFARTLNPNGGDAPIWPRYTDSTHSLLTMSVDTTPNSSKIEPDVDKRCGWWRRNPRALRSREKPWQLTTTPSDLGRRCCCDFDHSQGACKRVASIGTKKEESQSHPEANWQGHCPSLDMGYGLQQTHHDPLGCIAPIAGRHLRCCCAPLESSHPARVCQRLTIPQLNWRNHCPQICGLRDQRSDSTGMNPFILCNGTTSLRERERTMLGKRVIQTHHDPDAC